MTTNRPASLFFTYLLDVAVVFSLIGLWGCASSQPAQSLPTSKANAQKAELDLLRKGVEAFTHGRYNEAVHSFEIVTNQSNNAVNLRRALYGLACTKLAQAKDVKDLHDAQVIWMRWQNSRAKSMGIEDPLMLSPFVQRTISSAVPQNLHSTELIIHPEAAAACEAALDGKQKEIHQLKSKIESQEKDIASLHSRIEKLKGQINSLEKIHLEIQEKKKEVSSQ